MRVRISDFPLQMGRQRGLTIIELSVTMLVSSVMLLAVVSVLGSNQKSFNAMYQRVHGAIVNDAYVTRLTFDRLVRKASGDYCNPAEGVCTQIEIRYYSSPGVTAVDRFARFTYDSGAKTLCLTDGAIGSNPAAQILAHNVTSCTFLRSGPCIHMALVFNDGKVDVPIAVTATRHNG